MRYTKGKKDETRVKITSTASQLFRSNGINATGIQSLMGACGLTNGAFYGHFESKGDLVCAALAAALSENLESLNLSLAQGPSAIEAAVRDYLSMAHVEQMGAGCPTAALVSEVARDSFEVRATYTRGLVGLLDRITEAVPKDVADKVPAVFAMLVGCVQLARACTDMELANQILKSGIDSSISLLGLVMVGRDGVLPPM